MIERSGSAEQHNGADTPSAPKIGAIVETADHGRERVMDVIAKTVFLRPFGGGYERREISW